jgi:DNA-binding MarR family transcriptional regulator
MDDDGVIRLRRVISWLARQLNASSTGVGLTPSQSSVLSIIVTRGPLSLAELTSLEALNPTMLSRVVSKLQSMGLIDRTPDPSDLRSAWVSATDEGRGIDRQVKAEKAAAVSRCLEQLSPEQQRTLTAAIPVLEDLGRAMWRASHYGDVPAPAWNPRQRGSAPEAR